MSQKLLVKSCVDYSDEFDCLEFAVMTQSDYDAWVKRATKAIAVEDEFYFGTNEALQFSSFDELFSSLIITEITDEEFATLEKLFGPKYEWQDFVSFGTGSVFNIGEDELDD
jgi:hypothetical protein